MRIRTRLTLYYAAVLFVSLLVIGAFSYHELIGEPAKELSAATNPGNDPEEKAVENLARLGLWFGMPAVVLALAGGWWLMRKALAPIESLAHAAGRVHERNLHEKLPATGSGDELDQLTGVFNAMTDRLNGSFSRIREFTLNASHELKTPLTVMHGELETMLREESLSGSQQERLLRQLDEVQRLTKIVDGLTLLAKADAGQIALKHETVQLDDLVREAHSDAQILALPHSVRVDLKMCEVVSVEGDRHRLRQLLLNLADNAIKYNCAKGTVITTLRRDRDCAILEMANTGRGVGADGIDRVFDPFFRGHSSHNGNIEGCGLGLSISRWIVEAHGGTIQMTSQPGTVTTLTVRLPCESQSAFE